MAVRKGLGEGAQLIETSQVPRTNAMQMNHKLRNLKSGRLATGNGNCAKYSNGKTMARRDRERARGRRKEGERETKGSQPKWQLKLHLSVESSVKTGSHLAKLVRDKPKVLEQRQRERKR